MRNELLLLGLLRMQQMHGYELNEMIARDMPFVAPLKPATAYYTLARLCERGLVRESRERMGRRPERKVYEITELGERTFQQLLRENIRSFAQAASDDDIGLLFIAALPPAEAAKLLTKKIELLRGQLAHLQQARDLHSDETGGLVLERLVGALRCDEQYYEKLCAALGPKPPSHVDTPEG